MRYGLRRNSTAAGLAGQAAGSVVYTVQRKRIQVEAERIQRTYSHYAGVYDLVFDRILQPGRRKSVEVLRPEADEQVLEIGIGTGLSIPYYPTHCSITGIDLSAPMLREAEKKHDDSYPGLDLDLVQMDAGRLEFPDARFHCILASYVLSTVPDARKVLDEMVRVALPGARVVIVNHFRSSFPPVAGCERLLRPLSWMLGFRLDLPLEVVSSHPRLEITRVRRTNFLGLWTLVEARALPHDGYSRA
jgi:phosphatidylethanolamine/phosphatidyl-N-methylethanolamine N-methyltransferase